MNTEETRAGHYVVGTLKIGGKGIGYVTTEDERTVEIDPAFLNTGMHRDVVKVALLAKKGDTQTGEIVEIVKRNKMDLVGVLEEERGLYFVTPDDQKMYVDIAVPADEINGAKPGQKVFCRILKWENHKKNPVGRVLRILGEPGRHNVEMETIVLEKGFETSFPLEVEQEAQAIKAGAEEDFAREAKIRKDFRGVTTFTIDPVDAKDFDDALSFRRLENGNVEIGVHIADVSHFVRPGTDLDAEAAKRATSIYLVDRTVPMLPEILSNDLCSLMPNRDRLAFSAVFTFDSKREIVDEWFGKTIIHSDRRFSYEEAQEILDAGAGDFHDELKAMNECAYALRERKFANGAIVFEEEEVKFKLDENGKPLGVYKKVRGDTHKMIEDYMLLANKQVAAYVSKLNQDKHDTFVYRVHDVPDAEKIGQLASFLRPLGYKLEIRGEGVTSHEINRLLKQAEGTPEEGMINRATVRSMAKAIYSMRNIGHYGLAFEHYTHFTSPIRRYPDLMVHRLLEIYLAGDRPEAKMLEQYAQLVIHSSEMERLATEAERDSVKYKQVEYMQDHIGETYEGTISGISEWGIYVEEAVTKSEGMVRLRDLRDDFYEFDEKSYSMVGQKTKRRYRLGDTVKIKVANADLTKKIIDFTFVGQA